MVAVFGLEDGWMDGWMELQRCGMVEALQDLNENRKCVQEGKKENVDLECVGCWNDLET